MKDHIPANRSTARRRPWVAYVAGVGGVFGSALAAAAIAATPALADTSELGTLDQDLTSVLTSQGVSSSDASTAVADVDYGLSQLSPWQASHLEAGAVEVLGNPWLVGVIEGPSAPATGELATLDGDLTGLLTSEGVTGGDATTIVSDVNNAFSLLPASEALPFETDLVDGFSQVNL